jgi:PAS domain S-box-containing protein
MAERSALFRLIPPPDSRHSVAIRYSAALLISLLFLAVIFLLEKFLGNETPLLILLVPIALSAFYGGLGPGLASVLTMVALADYLLFPPLFTIGPFDAKSIVSNLLLAVCGLVVCVMGELGRSAVLLASHEADMRRMAQNQALVSEERLRITEQVVAGGVWEWDIPGKTVFWSDGYRRLLDYPMDEQPSQEKWAQSVHTEDRERVTSQVDDLLSDQRHHVTLEYRIVTASGRTRWISSHGRVFYDSTGQPKRMVGINVDVTSRHLAEANARSNETKMRLVMQYARVGDFEWNPRDGSMQCSPEFYEVLGLDPSVPPTFDALMKSVHPSDRERIHNILTPVPESPGRDFDFDARLRSADGVERLVHARGAAIRDETDGTLRVVGIAIDLSQPDKEMLAS